MAITTALSNVSTIPGLCLIILYLYIIKLKLPETIMIQRKNI